MEIALHVGQAASYLEAAQMLSRRGLTCDVSSLVRITTATAEASTRLRDAALEAALRLPVPPDGPLAGKRVRVGLDGGLVRTRCKHRGGKTAKGRHGFAAPWREPRVLVIDILDEQGQPDRLRLPLYDVLIGDAEATWALLIGSVRLLGARGVKIFMQRHNKDLSNPLCLSETIFTEKASGAQRDRPQLHAALDYMRPDDILVVWKLDRLARSLRQLLDTVEALSGRQIGLCSITEAIDTSTPGGTLVFHLFGALAEFERSIIRERTRAGLAAARARGRMGGRPPVLSAADKMAARAMLKDPAITVEAVAKRLQVSPATLYRHVPGGRSGVEEALG